MDNYDFDIDEIQDYLEGLCTRHKEIRHSSAKRSFARFQSNDHVNEIKKAASKICVIVGDIANNRVGHKDDLMVSRQITIRIAVYAELKGDATREKARAMQTAERITMDMITRMEKQQDDDLENDVYGPMHFLRPEEFSWEPIEDQPWLLNHYGYDVSIPFRHYTPAYDATKWDD